MSTKNILFKYGDKAIFAAFLAIFLWSTLSLISGQNAAGNITRIDRAGTSADPEIMVEVGLRETMERITKPPFPNAGNDLATDPEKYEPGPGEKMCPICTRIVPLRTKKCPTPGCPYVWETESTGGPYPTGPKPVSQPFDIIEIGQEPVDILFKGYIVDPGGNNEKPDHAFWSVQLNWGRGTQTRIIRYGGFFHGYRMSLLERKEEKVFNQNINEWVPFDVWFLTIQKKDHKPVIVKMNTEAREQELFVKLALPGDGDGEDTIVKFYDSDKFTVNGNEYTIFKVAETEAIIKDKNNKSIILTEGN